MDKEQLSFEVTTDLHHSLVEEASRRGVPLGTLCHALLAVALADNCESGVKESQLEVLTYASLSLLREEVKRVEAEKPEGWRKTLSRLNVEISRRFRT